MSTGQCAAAVAMAVALLTGCTRERPREPVAAPPVPTPSAPSAAPAQAPSAPAATPAVTIQTDRGPAMFHVQVAATPEERAAGLVGRPTLAADAGILFVFERAETQSLSTKDTLIPVDIVFIGADRRIVGIVPQAKPLHPGAHTVAAAARFALEIRGGLAAKLRLRVGQTVELRAIPGT